MTIYNDDYSAKINFEYVSFSDMPQIHRESPFGDAEEKYEDITIEYFANEGCSYYEA